MVGIDDVVDDAANAKDEKKTDDDTGRIFRPWTQSTADNMTATSKDFPAKAPLDSFEDSNVDDTPFEHSFQPGDHIIRWDMLPILWPIQIHGIVLEVSDDKTTVTICDFGITTVKNDAVEKKISKSGEKDAANMLEEENAKFNEAIEGKNGDGSGRTQSDESWAGAFKGSSKNRLNIIVLTKWSDLRKWKKVNYEGGLLGNKRGSVGKGLEKLGKQTEKLWKSFVRKESTGSKKVHHVPSVRHDVNDEGYCVHHPEIKLLRRREGDDESNDEDEWIVVRKKCPECILEDCPTMMGESPSYTLLSKEEDKDREVGSGGSDKSGCVASNLSSSDNINAPSGLNLAFAGSNPGADNHDVSHAMSKVGFNALEDSSKTLAQMISEANEVDRRTARKAVVKSAPATSVKELNPSIGSSWRQGSFMKSVSGLFSSQMKEREEESVNKETSMTSSEAKIKTNKSKANELPRSDPDVLVLARTRFILEHGEEVLPPYHIINSNSECIAVW
jgi:hypothetical protein